MKVTLHFHIIIDMKKEVDRLILEELKIPHPIQESQLPLSIKTIFKVYFAFLYELE